MAGFVNTDQKRAAVRQAASFLDVARSFYAQGKLIQEAHRSHDPTFKSAIDVLFTKDEWKKLKQML